MSRYYCVCCEKAHKPRGKTCACHCSASKPPDARALKIREQYA